jgi:2'-5' RNA ligase
MSKKAVDVVLLPTEAMMDKAIKANRQLVERYGEKIVLNDENCLPHISLAMGVVDEKDIAAIEKVLEEIAAGTSLSDLTIVGVQTSTNLAGEKVSVLEVERTEQLRLLHEEVMEELAPFLTSDVTADMLYEPATVGRPTLHWIRNYRANSSFEMFSPHITIGYGEVDDFPLLTKFAVSKLALCHLGNHCTCRKILASTEIATRP